MQEYPKLQGSDPDHERSRQAPDDLREGPPNGRNQLILAAVAAFCTYFCMYAFRKPFTAGTFETVSLNSIGLKTTLVIAQIAGYTLSKFIGIPFISGLSRDHRTAGIIGLILFAEVSLIGFASVPVPWKPMMMFLNGLPLGMVFGIVLSYLEGRKQTEALSAVLGASFIVSSGVVKSIGRWMIDDLGYSEFTMPMLVGLVFLPPLLLSVWLLQSTPPPDQQDRRLRRDREPMTRAARRMFWRAYWPGLSMLVLVYVALTVVRTIRDDFGVEIWRDLGVEKQPSVFTRTELVVAIIVTTFNGLTMMITHNLRAIRYTVAIMSLSFGLVAASAVLQGTGYTSPFWFMVACGVGLYIPYVAFHTTLFERLVAVSRHPGNLVFLMYVADALGYLGYTFVLVARTFLSSPESILPAFRFVLVIVGLLCVCVLVIALLYFQRVLGVAVEGSQHEEATQTATNTEPNPNRPSV